jgi:hypothetical protein
MGRNDIMADAKQCDRCGAFYSNPVTEQDLVIGKMTRESEKWIYVAQYTANAEGWNCILTDTIIFFSQNYSYKTLIQACGRINRANTPFVDLYYYHFKCRFGIDLAISDTLKNKKEFNERKYYEKLGG